MSADNYAVVKKKLDGWYWGDFDASHDTGPNHELPDEQFDQGPFETEDEAYDNAYDDRFWEYGVGVLDEHLMKPKEQDDIQKKM